MTLQYFLPFIRYGRPVPFFCHGFVRDVFERLCEIVEEKATRSLFCKSVRHFVVKMSLRFVNGSAVFSRRYGRFCQLKVRPF